MNAEMLGERLFYLDPWLKEADVVVKATKPVVNRGSTILGVLLSETIFYPEGGGQPADLGFIEDKQVMDVQEIEGEIWHYIELQNEKEEEILKPGSAVHLSLDWPRRLYHMQQHTGQHLLSAVLEEEYGIHTISFHLGTEYCTIDVSAKDPTELPLAQIETEVEAWIERDASVLVHYCPPEDISTFRLRKRPPINEAVIRVVEIQGYDCSPCGGTHLERTGQVRALKVLSLERYKGHVRMYFASGAHAIELMSRAYEDNREAATLLGSSIGDISIRLREILEKSALLEKRAKRCLVEHAEAEAKLASIHAGPSDIIHFTLEKEDADWGTMLCKAAVSLGRPAIASCLLNSTIIIQVPAKARFPALSTVLSEIMLNLGGKGGGGEVFYRASFASADMAKQFALKAKEVLEGFQAT